MRSVRNKSSDFLYSIKPFPVYLDKIERKNRGNKVKTKKQPDKNINFFLLFLSQGKVLSIFVLLRRPLMPRHHPTNLKATLSITIYPYVITRFCKVKKLLHSSPNCQLCSFLSDKRWIGKWLLVENTEKEQIVESTKYVFMNYLLCLICRFTLLLRQQNCLFKQSYFLI